MKNIIKSVLIALACSLLFFTTAYADEPVVIVIDPGHGGENMGGMYDGFVEKDMTMIIANAMKDELEQYENVSVYLTHDIDKDMSLRERCEYAADKHTDFLFCLHLNMSEDNNLYGAETWVSAFGDGYKNGYEYSRILMDEFEEAGLYSRGIKTRLNDSGLNYYGILRESMDLELDCVLIEHAHIDHPNDYMYVDDQADLIQFGKMDAEAVAKYFRLTKKDHSISYSDYTYETIEAPSDVVKPDKSEPSICEIETISYDENDNIWKVAINASDDESGIYYYSYSLDNGITYSELYPWEDHFNPSVTLDIPVDSNHEYELIVQVWNNYDKYTNSNSILLKTKEENVEANESIEQISSAEDEETLDSLINETIEKEEMLEETNESQFDLVYVITIAFIILGMIIVLVIFILTIYAMSRPKKRKIKRDYDEIG